MKKKTCKKKETKARKKTRRESYSVLKKRKTKISTSSIAKKIKSIKIIIKKQNKKKENM